MSVSPDIPSAPRPMSPNMAADVKEPATTMLSSSNTTWPARISSSKPPPDRAHPRGPWVSSATETRGRTITKTTASANSRRIYPHLLLSLELMAWLPTTSMLHYNLGYTWAEFSLTQ